MAEAIGVKSGAIGLEWNALTYAGHTVWNVHNETRGSGYKGGTKRRRVATDLTSLGNAKLQIFFLQPDSGEV